MCQNVIKSASNMGKRTTVHIVKRIYLFLTLMMSHHPFLHKFKTTNVCLLRWTCKIAIRYYSFFLEILKILCEICSLICDPISGRSCVITVCDVINWYNNFNCTLLEKDGPIFSVIHDLVFWVQNLVINICGDGGGCFPYCEHGHPNFNCRVEFV
jgi:hypothetical protein